MLYLADSRSMRFMFPRIWRDFAYPRNQANLRTHVSNHDLAQLALSLTEEFVPAS